MHIEIGNESSSIICIGIFFLVFMVALIFILISAHKRKQALLGILDDVGFVIQPEAAPKLLEKLQPLYGPTRVEKVGMVAVKLIGDEMFYLYDCTTGNSQKSYSRTRNSSSTEYSNLAVISPHFKLPSFILINRTSAPGNIGSMIDDLLIMQARSIGYAEWQYCSPAFNIKFILLSKSEERMLETFTTEVQERIIEMGDVLARGEDDTLVFNRNEIRRGVKLDAAQLADYIQDAREFCGLMAS